jgi:hypothetical protein
MNGNAEQTEAVSLTTMANVALPEDRFVRSAHARAEVSVNLQ